MSTQIQWSIQLHELTIVYASGTINTKGDMSSIRRNLNKTVVTYLNWWAKLQSQSKTGSDKNLRRLNGGKKGEYARQ